jgi:hypothetical protein
MSATTHAGIDMEIELLVAPDIPIQKEPTSGRLLREFRKNPGLQTRMSPETGTVAGEQGFSPAVLNYAKSYELITIDVHAGKSFTGCQQIPGQ